MSAFTGVMLGGYTVLSVITGGSCPIYEPLDSFDPDQFKGVWYELQRDAEISFETGECITAQYGTYAKNDRYVSVENTEFWPDDSTHDKIYGYAAANRWYPGSLNVYFFGGFGADYRVVDTDYSSYALIYSCSNVG